MYVDEVTKKKVITITIIAVSLVLVWALSSKFYFQSGYISGFNDGKELGDKEGYTRGYNSTCRESFVDGMSEGYSSGYGVGFSDGCIASKIDQC